jgi:hypothetical protein
VIGFGHIWDNQATFPKLRTLSAIIDKLQNRYFDFWHKLLIGYNPSSPKIAILVAEL